MSISIELDSTSTLNAADESYPIVHVSGDCYRLIPSRFPPIDIYERLACNDRIAALAEVENLTNPRVRSMEALTGGLRPVDPTSPLLQNWNLAPFAYPNPEGSRFFRPNLPCLDLAEDLQTALATSVQRREIFLKRTSEPATGLDMRVLKTPIEGSFVDLRGVPIELAQDSRWLLGDRIYPQACAGILYTSPERPSGTCMSVIRKNALGRSEQTKHFRFVWDGRRISTLYAFDDARKLVPEEIASTDTVIAA
ncbi:MAG TPA: RES family NAD+ phosphorylase [Allosphingosinicella sp.]